MSVYVVTGGAGFIGSSIVLHLCQQGEKVRVVDDFSAGKRENLAEAEGRFELFEGDICDPLLVEGAFEGADFILHQAAVASVQRSVEDPAAADRVNAEGTLNVMLAAKKCSAKRVVYASSSAIYGGLAEQPKREDMPPDPRSPYAASKLGGEYYCRVFHRVYGLETVVLRYFNVFGPRQEAGGSYPAVIPAFVQAAMQGRSPTVFGDGEQSRDYVYVEDVVRANVLAAAADGAAGETFNVGTGTRFSLNELARLLSRIFGRRLQTQHEPERQGDVRHSQADIGKVRRLLGYEPVVCFEEGLRRTVQWHLAR